MHAGTKVESSITAAVWSDHHSWHKASNIPGQLILLSLHSTPLHHQVQNLELITVHYKYSIQGFMQLVCIEVIFSYFCVDSQPTDPAVRQYILDFWHFVLIWQENFGIKSCMFTLSMLCYRSSPQAKSPIQWDSFSFF